MAWSTSRRSSKEKSRNIGTTLCQNRASIFYFSDKIRQNARGYEVQHCTYGPTTIQLSYTVVRSDISQVISEKTSSEFIVCICRTSICKRRMYHVSRAPNNLSFRVIG